MPGSSRLARTWKEKSCTFRYCGVDATKEGGVASPTVVTSTFVTALCRLGMGCASWATTNTSYACIADKPESNVMVPTVSATTVTTPDAMAPVTVPRTTCSALGASAPSGRTTANTEPASVSLTRMSKLKSPTLAATGKPVRSVGAVSSAVVVRSTRAGVDCELPATSWAMNHTSYLHTTAQHHHELPHACTAKHLRMYVRGGSRQAT